jgi:hypothetical protein
MYVFQKFIAVVETKARKNKETFHVLHCLAYDVVSGCS